MTVLQRVAVLSLAAALLCGAPVSAKPECASDTNIAHVNWRLQGAIQRLQHDASDYGGFKAQALSDLSNARADLASAQQWAINKYGDSPSCFQASGPTNGGNIPWGGTRAQGGSNKDMWGVHTWIARLIHELNGDNRDYGGYKGQAITALESARDHMLAAENYAQSHGN
jgi:hypothetical protein